MTDYGSKRVKQKEVIERPSAYDHQHDGDDRTCKSGISCYDRKIFPSLSTTDQTCQPPKHANLEMLKKSPEKPGDWDLKPGDFQNKC